MVNKKKLRVISEKPKLPKRFIWCDGDIKIVAL